MLVGGLTPGDHQAILTVCTVDVHVRDVAASVEQRSLLHSNYPNAFLKA
ncbi:rCG26423, isoform CRA_b [Rattus norvegicus]|uniref:RCG26423, isoform CRA_b n=1 Tax=Rattus norvegicus TaxID=10116 RepID=A6HM79_RAT|nr:rCG26423, isoform CRA_b [Rattus norvegicus]